MMCTKPKFALISLLTGSVLLTACSEKIDPVEANLVELEQSCIKVANIYEGAHFYQKLCACVKSKMETGYSEKEQKIVTSVFTDTATYIEQGQDEPSEIDLIMLHSDFDKEEAERFFERVQNDVKQCENNNG